MKTIDSLTVLLVTISSLTFFILGVGLTAFSEFDSTFGDIATWLAAIGTVGTLVFAVRQNKQLRLEQIKEKEDREAHEKKQQEMWAEQKEHLSFEKFQTHKTMFNGMLKELEKKFEGEFSFYDVDGLYEKIFPDNNFLYCQTKINLDSESENSAGSLKDALVCYSRLNSNLDQCHSSTNNYYSHAHDFLDLLLSQSSLLHINFIPKSEYGGIYLDIEEHQPYFLLNVFSPLRTAVIIENVLHRICSFTGNQGEVVTLSHKEGSYLFNIIQKFAFTSANLRGYRFETNDKANVIYLLNDIKLALFYYRPITAIPVNTRYLYLENLFTSEHRMEKYLSSDSHQIGISLEDMAFLLKDLRENFVYEGEQTKSLKKLEERATSLKNAYKHS